MPASIKNHFRLEKFELQPDRPEFLAAEEILIGIGQPVGRRHALRRPGLALGPEPVLAAVGKRIPDLICALGVHFKFPV
jgi:hypothetical protein